MRPRPPRFHLSLQGSCMQSHWFILLPVTFAILSATGCGTGNAEHVAAAPPPQTVSVIEVQPRTVPIFAEYAAQTFARDAAEIRGQVDGYIRKRLFNTGADVKAGETLYILDLRPYQADVAKAT